MKTFFRVPVTHQESSGSKMSTPFDSRSLEHRTDTRESRKHRYGSDLGLKYRGLDKRKRVLEVNEDHCSLLLSLRT